ncbi:hypothetical protein C454_00070 [Haloferax gibbonsii ATCC 33959]|uniref:Uncharacterized protein n=1 Tax=Haloferax gibbonsii (strain ATCC 33959 / DSM 4427 / JCM 8863 / NBRC 102184 / NCIMB 2188 / Ma 2.38) TaxID=1227459 RepID=M0HQM2_HALGM|nr:hypothetical protein [Haloferax gibbonsii]ELZ86900.1 hypothetical protein C454_00070 [Haloferax gibbonsii ATCC 33959]
MADYQFAVNKPDRVLINYNTVRSAELKAVYESLVSNRTVQSIVSDFAHEKEDNVRNCISFLHAIDLIERGGDDRVVSPLNRDMFPNLEFEARFLYHLRQQRFPKNHLTRIQNVALETADRSVTLDVLLPRVKGELDQYDFAWNETKLRMWRALSTQLGLVSETKTRGVILSPCRRLLYDLLELYEQQEDSTDLYSALTWIEENFFNVFETTTGSPRVHPAISDVLQNMESEDVLELRGMSDARDTVTLPESVHTQRSRSVNVYDLATLPDSPTYQYPLSQFEQVITQ